MFNTSEYLAKIKNFQEHLLNFIDDEQNVELNYQFLIKLFIDQKIQNDQHNLGLLFHLICQISNNHYRSSDFFNKIERILFYFKDKFSVYFSNFEIFNIFKSNKRIILFLIKEKILIIDKIIYYHVIDDKYKHADYSQYFSPEIDLLKKKSESIKPLENFEEKRKIGENDSYICTMIRKDMITEFITYANKTNLKLSRHIEHSIYESNSFLIDKEPTLIEYAAFYGSIQIFQYLKLNNIEITPSLWLYAIHGRNAELIHIIEENLMNYDSNFYKECFIESIKCHHNELTDYIQNNYFLNERDICLNTFEIFLKYYNFDFIQIDFINKSAFYDLCKYDYFTLVDFLFKKHNIDINSLIICQINFYSVTQII